MLKRLTPVSEAGLKIGVGIGSRGLEYDSWGLVKEVGCGPRPDTGVVHIIASGPG